MSARAAAKAAPVPAAAKTKSALAKLAPKTQRRRVAGVDDRVPLLLYTVEQAAQALGCKKRKMEVLIARGCIGVPAPDGIYSMKIGGLRRVPVWALEAYTRPQTGQQSA
jgi:excisionase family DNA binding protein